MFSLENELNKRIEIVVARDELVEKKTALEQELALVNEELGKYDYSEIDNEIAEIRHLMGLDRDENVEQEVVTEQIVEENLEA